MTERDIAQEILEGIREIKAHKAGEKVLRTHTLREPAPPQVIRANLQLSQAAFAALMGVSVRTIQDWEQGRRKPSGPALALLRIAEQRPDAFTQIAKEDYVQEHAHKGNRTRFEHAMAKVAEAEPPPYDVLE